MVVSQVSLHVHEQMCVPSRLCGRDIRNKKGKEEKEETKTTIGILRETLNINSESGGVSRRFIHVFVHGGKSFAVCQRF